MAKIYQYSKTSNGNAVKNCTSASFSNVSSNVPSLDTLAQLVTNPPKGPFSGPQNSSNSAVFDADFASVLDTKETLRHFSRFYRGSEGQRRSFLLKHYRWRNLSLATGLENSSLLSDLDDSLETALARGEVSLSIKLNSQGNEKKVYQVLTTDEVEAAFLKNAIKHRTTIINSITGLRYCCRSVVVGSDDKGAEVVASSNSCKNQHCCICARRKAAKYGARLHAAIEDEDNAHLFDGKYFYFVTLTLKHDSVTRNGVYLKELRDSMTKLFNRKFWKDITKDGGWITHVEMTMKNNQYHIHSHVLVCCDRIKKPVKSIQAELRKNWESITGDSYMASWDLVKGRKVDGKRQMFSKDDKKAMQSAVMELFKYSTKTGLIGYLTDADYDSFATFVAWTKGKKFISAGGFMKGMDITSNKSKYDTPAPDVELDLDCFFGLATKDVKFNKNPCRDYSEKAKNGVNKEVYLSEISNYEEIVEEAIGWYFNENPNKGSLDDWLDRTCLFVSAADGTPESIELSDIELNEAVARITQMSLFDDS